MGHNVLKSWLYDMKVLKSMWFSHISGSSHKERLESFYAPQADAYDSFRCRMLHGRERLIEAYAKRMDEEDEGRHVWVDIGGGTGENVRLMSKHVELERMFHKIYVVDICGSLCNVARRKAAEYGWSNVEVVEEDACSFQPSTTPVTLITFSYSLSMIPNFMEAIDNCVSFMDPHSGIVGVTDFYTSLKHDLPIRQNGYICRWFWRVIFDMDNIEVGSGRRQYLEHAFHTEYEENNYGSIPYVPFVKAPYYVWLGKRRRQNSYRQTNGCNSHI